MIGLVRFKTGESEKYGFLQAGTIHELRISSNRELLAILQQATASADASSIAQPHFSGEQIALNQARLLSPVEPGQIICQGKNYGDHVKETGMRLQDKNYNLFFSKAASSIAPPSGIFTKPTRVKLLDYELELGLLIGAPIKGPQKISESDLPKYICGMLICLDMTARDIQISRGQWFEGKSLRGFCPAGPIVVPFSSNYKNLELRLTVNGEVRQQTLVDRMLYRPHDTLSQLSEFMDLSPGDLLLTGTPGGVALKAPPARLRNFAGAFLGEKKAERIFIKKQSRRRAYLHPGDILKASIATADGTIDLGMQEHRIVGE
jgi:2-keto-4-pentenoate hydratase/2-oxohepta-3-ene-1,7-dioic acid hydratase in catechol pathway